MRVMTDGNQQRHIRRGKIPPAVLGAVALLLAMAVLGALTGLAGFLGALVAILTDLPVAGAIFLAAGGWGWLAIHKFLPDEAPTGLVAVTSVGAGLWLLGTAVLVVGSSLNGALSAGVWWPVVAAGWGLAAIGGRRSIQTIGLPAKVSAATGLWLLPAVAVGLWIAGAALPPGHVGGPTADAYDVVSYQLQVPREFYDAGRIGFLPHNTYSNYPLGAQMLFLLSMCLKGGAHAGMYAAKFTHGMWGVLAVGAVYFGLAGCRPWRRRAAAVLLATLPAAIYLSWLAFVELSELAYLAIGIAWLRMWLATPSRRSAAMIGLAAGGACATKYLSVGLVAGPLLAVLLAVCLPRPRRLGQWALACLVCLVAAAPWLIRNGINTANPAFPLATSLLGRGHWSPESAERWDAGHTSPSWSQRPVLFGRAVTDPRGLGLPMWALAAIAAGWMIVRRRNTPSLDEACLAVAVVQLAAWIFATHMPARFLAPAAVPMAILAGGIAARIAGRRPAPGGSAFRSALAVAVVALAAGWNLLTAWHAYRAEPGADPQWVLHGLPEDELMAGDDLFDHFTHDTRLGLVGEARAFHFPANTLYATAWEPGPLVRIARTTRRGDQIIGHLRDELGLTHLYVNWHEIHRLKTTYGWWREIDRDLIEGLIDAGATDVGRSVNSLQEVPAIDGRPGVQLLVLPTAE